MRGEVDARGGRCAGRSIRGEVAVRYCGSIAPARQPLAQVAYIVLRIARPARGRDAGHRFGGPLGGFKRVGKSEMGGENSVVNVKLRACDKVLVKKEFGR
jgi:hypothetical protein